MPRKPRQNRAYKKGEAHRDARLFVIVAEGEREDAYFKHFHALNRRVRVQIIPREGGKSAPSFFLERVQKVIENGGWSPNDGDLLWFVLDVDRWPRAIINELHIHCQQNKNWFIGISNPCFEVWLLFHFLKSIDDQNLSCRQLKKQLSTVSEGNMSVERFSELIGKATQNAAASDTHPDNFFPDRMQTKLYQLAQELLALLGNNWKT